MTPLPGPVGTGTGPGSTDPAPGRDLRSRVRYRPGRRWTSRGLEAQYVTVHR